MSDRGKVRPNNEDSFVCLQFDAREPRLLGKVGEGSLDSCDFVFAVSDGMGGAMAGEYASRIVVEKITRLLPPAYRRSAAGLAAGHEEVLAQLFLETHRALAYLGSCYEECAGMGATLTLCWIEPGRLHFAHLGDSRLYYLPGDGSPMRQITDDHTHVGWLFRMGKINEREARNHPGRNALQKALGAGHQFVDPQVGVVALARGDRFLLCTDGLVEGLFDEHLSRLLRHPDASEAHLPAATRLVGASVERSGRDNTTAVVVEVG
jgi:PPM family protein phosphatase